MRRPSRDIGTRANQSAKPRPKVQTRCVLVVDSDPQIAASLKDGASGVSVLHGATIAEARAALASQDVDVAVIADMLPDGEGLALAGDLISGRHPVQTIVLAANPSFNQAIHAMRMGASDLLVKPLNSRELHAVVQFRASA